MIVEKPDYIYFDRRKKFINVLFGGALLSILSLPPYDSKPLNNANVQFDIEVI